MVQPQDYIHKSGTAGLTLQNYALRSDSATGSPSTLGNQLLAQPFFTGDQDLELAGMGIYCSATGTGNQRIAVYSAVSTSNIYPNALLYDLGSVSYAGTGVRLITTPITLTAGQLYWLVTLSDGGTGTHYAVASSNSNNYPAGILGLVPFSGANPPAVNSMFLSVSRTYGLGMPATFLSGATAAYNSSGALPAIVLEPT